MRYYAMKRLISIIKHRLPVSCHGESVFEKFLTYIMPMGYKPFVRIGYAFLQINFGFPA